ncbi:MAG TPA: OmpA family protein [bacterium]|nr:OmpA family protein [bacterium]
MMVRARAIASFMVAALAFDIDAAAQDVLHPFAPPVGRIIVTERSDFSRYDDGHYLGHVYREARLNLAAATQPDNSTIWRGEALVLEETMHDQRATARRLDTSLPVEFKTGAQGSTQFTVDEGYPILRGVPCSPATTVLPQGRWTGEGVVVVRPRSDSPATRVPVLVEYEYIGPARYGDTAALAIRARYAVRYRGGDSHGDPSLVRIEGGRVADIMLDASDGSTLFIRETVDETSTYADGCSVRLKGFILHFHRGSLPSDHDQIASIVTQGEAVSTTPARASPLAAPVAGNPSAAGPQPAATPATVPVASPATTGGIAATAPAATPTGNSAFEVSSGDRGVVLLLYDLRFVADGDDLLPSERGRLDAIAVALNRIPDHTFLVEGHTADLGRPAGQYELSERRAKRIVDELVARGIPAGRFVYRGLGADHPIAPNDTEANRARNRRVEITILD